MVSGHAFCRLRVLLNLVEVHVAVGVRRVFAEDAHGLLVLGHCGQFAHLGSDGGQLGGGQEQVAGYFLRRLRKCRAFHKIFSVSIVQL